MDTEYIYFSQKILYTRQVVGDGAGDTEKNLKESGRAHPGRAHPENKKKQFRAGPPWEGPPGE